MVTANPTVALSSVLRFHLATSRLSVPSIVDTRVLLETWAIGNVKQGSPALGEAETILQQLQSIAEASHFLELDVRFHAALVKAARNYVVDVLMESLCDSIRNYTAGIAANLDDWTSVRARLEAEHHAILAALQEGDPREASTLVADHIERYYA
jgi:GntR family transcriptional repressor for pyruvate dehydrogenase complex